MHLSERMPPPKAHLLTPASRPALWMGKRHRLRNLHTITSRLTLRGRIPWVGRSPARILTEHPPLRRNDPQLYTINLPRVWSISRHHAHAGTFPLSTKRPRVKAEPPTPFLPLSLQRQIYFLKVRGFSVAVPSPCSPKPPNRPHTRPSRYRPSPDRKCSHEMKKVWNVYHHTPMISSSPLFSHESSNSLPQAFKRGIASGGVRCACWRERLSGSSNPLLLSWVSEPWDGGGRGELVLEI